MRDRRLLTWRRVLRDGMLLYFAVLFVRSFIVDVYVVPSGSMRPTLVAGDYILVNKLAYGFAADVTGVTWGSVQRGDVIVFNHPRSPDRSMVKRIVGLPGDRIAAADLGMVLINDRPLERRRFGDDMRQWIECTEREGCYPIRDIPFARDPVSVGSGKAIAVSSGHFFVLGDDRLGSDDSRLGWQVPQALVQGRVEAIAWSYVPSDTDGIISIIDAMRWDRLGRSIAVDHP